MTNYVSVLDINGQPLMPTRRFGKVRRLLKAGLAKPVNNRLIFTIQLLYEPETHEVQYMTGSFDSGSKHLGISVSTEKKEYFAAEVVMRGDEIKSNVEERRECRRSRRSKLRSRPARFNNRKKPEGWLPPSTQHKVDVQEQYIQKCMDIFPISLIRVERGQFDMAKILNPEISGVDYQNGEQSGFENTKSYIRWRDNYKCRQCGKSDGMLHVHHIQFKSQGGSDRPSNLVTLCEKCHNKVHRKKNSLILKDSIMNQKNGTGLRDTSQMNVVGKFLMEHLNELYKDTDVKVEETYGYITKENALKYNVEKSHVNDARIISGNFHCRPVDSYLKITLKRRHKRKLATYAPLPRNKKTGKSPGRSSKKAIESVNGFRKGDLVLYNGDKITITGLRATGYFKGFNQTTQTVVDSFSSNKCKLIKHGTRHVVEEIQRIPMRH